MNRLLKLLIVDCIAGRTRSSKLFAEEARTTLLFRQLMAEFMENYSMTAIANVEANVEANIEANEEIMDTEFIGLGGAFDDEGEINVIN